MKKSASITAALALWVGAALGLWVGAARAEEPPALANTVTALVVRDGVETASHAEGGRLELAPGDRLELSLRLLDATHATFTVSGLPEGARAEAQPNGVDVSWTPGDGDAGMHDVRIVADDTWGRADRSLHIFVDARGVTLIAPGPRLVTWVPNATGALGAFVGGGVDLTLLAWASPGQRFWPSHGRIYVYGDVLGSPRVSKPAFEGGLGFEVSLERDPARRFLIPFVGLEGGATYAEATGAFGWAMPRAGIYLWTSRAVRVAIDGGYMLPSTAAQDVRGPRFAACADFGFW